MVNRTVGRWPSRLPCHSESPFSKITRDETLNGVRD
jgi:hypothetical protein